MLHFFYDLQLIFIIYILHLLFPLILNFVLCYIQIKPRSVFYHATILANVLTKII